MQCTYYRRHVLIKYHYTCTADHLHRYMCKRIGQVWKPYPLGYLQLYPQGHHFIVFGNAIDIAFFKVKVHGNPWICQSGPPPSNMDIRSKVDIRKEFMWLPNMPIKIHDKHQWGKLC